MTKNQKVAVVVKCVVMREGRGERGEEVTGGC